jgi:transcriptional regulator with XRE-family HTH domain
VTQSPATPLPPPKERRRLREAGSLTQAQVAERVGVSRETVRSWETGRTNPRGRKREAYAKLLTSLGEEETVTEPPAVEAAEVEVVEVGVVEVVDGKVVDDTAVLEPVLVEPVLVPVPITNHPALP